MMIGVLPGATRIEPSLLPFLSASSASSAVRFFTVSRPLPLAFSFQIV